MNDDELADSDPQMREMMVDEDGRAIGPGAVGRQAVNDDEDIVFGLFSVKMPNGGRAIGMVADDEIDGPAEVLSILYQALERVAAANGMNVNFVSGETPEEAAGKILYDRSRN